MKKPDPRALNPNLKFGRGIIAEASKDWGEYLLITTPEVLKSVEKMLGKKPAQIYFVQTLDLTAIEPAVKELPEAETIVGIGGGMAIDLAKFAAWKQGKEPVLVPSAASVDASVCASIAVRNQHRVKYLGYAIAQAILCDFALLQSAPINLNRAGIGDILSIHSALWDWNLAEKKGKGKYLEESARGTSALVDQLEKMAGEIRVASEKALQWLMQAYAQENAICIRTGNSRPEEGSEHFFAYNVEYQTRRAYVHGELVCLGVVLMSRLQENNVARVEKILKQTGVRYQPKELGISRPELEHCLFSLKEYAEKENLVYSVINEKPITERTVKEICKDLKS